jgi:hypothetical protein
MGAPGRGAHARLRGRRRVAGPADGAHPDLRPAQDRLGHGGADRARVVAEHLDERRLLVCERLWVSAPSTIIDLVHLHFD